MRYALSALVAALAASTALSANPYTVLVAPANPYTVAVVEAVPPVRPDPPPELTPEEGMSRAILEGRSLFVWTRGYRSPFLPPPAVSRGIHVYVADDWWGSVGPGVVVCTPGRLAVASEKINHIYRRAFVAEDDCCASSVSGALPGAVLPAGAWGSSSGGTPQAQPVQRGDLFRVLDTGSRPPRRWLMRQVKPGVTGQGDA